MTNAQFKSAAADCPMTDKHGIDEMKKPSVFDVFKFSVWVVGAIVMATIFTQQSAHTTELAEQNAAAIVELKRDGQGNAYNIQAATAALDKTNEALDKMLDKMNANAAEDAAAHGRIGGLERDVERLEDRASGER